MQDAIVGSCGSYWLACENNGFDRLQTQNPIVLLVKPMNFDMLGPQDPIVGSCGSYCFERQSCGFAHFHIPSRALIIIQNKARGASWNRPGGLL